MNGEQDGATPSAAEVTTTAEAAEVSEMSQVEGDFLLRQSMVGELEEFFPPEFLDKVKTRFEARLAERDAPPTS